MAAYAALTSLIQILDQLWRHAFPPISLGRQQVDSLREISTFLQEFLEGYNSPFVDSDEADPLEMRIADAAYAAEDVIESNIVDVIQLRQSASAHILTRIWSSFINLFRYNKERATRDLQKVMKEMDSIKKTVEMMREKSSTEVQPHQQQTNISRSLSANVKNSGVMVGFDDVLLQLLDKLTGGPSSRQVIPITGMGGIGKTTLAQNIFEHTYVKEYFDIRAWVTISQQYNTKEILSKILSKERGKSSEKSTVEELGDELHKCLFRRRYLIIIDDLWSTEVWEKISLYFPGCNQGSRVVVTTRQSFLTSELTSDPNNVIDMKFLDEVNSRDLFSKTIFGEKSFPVALEEIGKKIVKNCGGLPLSIVVIGGLLAKSQHTQEYWEHIEKNFNSKMNSENDEYCPKMLKLSYNHLPAYLKPCFLYMGIFEEDTRIHVSTLIKLWVCEGFLKPKNGKSLETIGKEFLKELIDRNLILIHALGSTGEIKYCKMHDLLRDLSLKEAEKGRFYHVIGEHNPQRIQEHIRRRLVYPGRISKERAFGVLKSTMFHVRSFTSQSQYGSVGLLLNFRLLRIFNMHLRNKEEFRLEDVIHKLVNSRYVAIDIKWHTGLPSLVNFLWNLHVLRIFCSDAPVEIWNMSQLRHVEFLNDDMYLPEPPSGGSTVILENLQTLKGIVNLKFGEELMKRIPNVKRLLIIYKQLRDVKIHDRDNYCLNNLQCLHKLESLTMRVYYRHDYIMHDITFPQSLRKLSLESPDNWIEWQVILEKMRGSSPHLQKLKLERGRFRPDTWKTIEGRFPSLKFLKLNWCNGLQYWITESSHFPCLEHLYLARLENLEEIPLEIGEIPTLQLIQLRYCKESVVRSAKKIVDVQAELQGGEQQLPFLVRVWDSFENEEALQSLASPNFQFTWTY